MTQILNEIPIPYIVLQGETDIVTNTQMVKHLIEKSENSKLRCKVIRGSGHIPNADGMDVALEELLCLK